MATDTFQYKKIASGNGGNFTSDNQDIISAYSMFKDGDKGMLQIDFNSKASAELGKLTGLINSHGANASVDESNKNRVNVEFTSGQVNTSGIKDKDNSGVLGWLKDNEWIITVILALIVVFIVVVIFVSPGLIASIGITLGSTILSILALLIVSWIIYKLVQNVLTSIFGSSEAASKAMPFIIIGGLLVTALMLSGSQKGNRPQVVIIENKDSSYPYSRLPYV